MRIKECLTCAVLVHGLTWASAQADQVDMSQYYDAGNAYFFLEVSCRFAVVDNAETGNSISLTLWNGNELLSQAFINPSSCYNAFDTGVGHYTFYPGGFDDRGQIARWSGNQGLTLHRPTHFIIETDGSDAFFIDRFSFTQGVEYDNYGSESTTREIGSWGVDYGGGWCLSRDPNDYSGAWAQAAVFCAPAMRVDVATGAITRTTATDLAAFHVRVDCVHSYMENTNTASELTLTLYDDNERHVASQVHENRENYVIDGNPLECRVDESDDSLEVSQFQFVGHAAVDWSDVAFLVLEIGEDYTYRPAPIPDFAVPETQFILQAAEMIKKSLTNYYVDQLFLYRNGQRIARWGGNDGMGWCLSNYPDSFVSDWHTYSVGGCYPGIVFDIDTLQTFKVD